MHVNAIDAALSAEGDETEHRTKRGGFDVGRDEVPPLSPPVHLLLVERRAVVDLIFSMRQKNERVIALVATFLALGLVAGLQYQVAQAVAFMPIGLLVLLLYALQQQSLMQASRGYLSVLDERLNRIVGANAMVGQTLARNLLWLNAPSLTLYLAQLAVVTLSAVLGAWAAWSAWGWVGLILEMCMLSGLAVGAFFSARSVARTFQAARNEARGLIWPSDESP